METSLQGENLLQNVGLGLDTNQFKPARIIILKEVCRQQQKHKNLLKSMQRIQQITTAGF